MARLRAVRSSSRARTPTAQVPSAASTPQPGRAARKRTTRSVSRDAEDVAAASKPLRRSARQASVASDSEQEGRTNRAQKRHVKDVMMGDLTVVEEVDTQIAIDIQPQTPPRTTNDDALPHNTPGAASQMSGTTAITSFSSGEAEMLDSRSILRNLSQLYNVSKDFLEHLVPAEADMQQDQRNIHEFQKPDSEFTQDYKDFNEQIALYLGKYRSEHQQYIGIRAVRRALVGPDRDPSSTPSGLDLVLYLANILVFAKHMIGSERGQKEMWDTLRELNQPQSLKVFLPAVGGDEPISPFGESGLAEETFELALELRTQLAILCLERVSSDDVSSPAETLREVFYSASSDGSSFVLEGWGINGLGGAGQQLSEEQQLRVEQQLETILEFLPADANEDLDLKHLKIGFPWEATVLHVLHWVRLRNQELQTAIEDLDGISGIIGRVKVELATPPVQDGNATNDARAILRKSRSSFGEGRRRSSRKFDPNDAANDAGVFALKARERQRRRQPAPDLAQVAAVPVEPQPTETELPVADVADEAFELGDDDDLPQPAAVEPEKTTAPEVSAEANEDPPVVAPAVEATVASAAPSTSSAPSVPQTSLDFVKLTQEARKLDKENRAQTSSSQQITEEPGPSTSRSLFTRQPNAARIEFGDGFDNTQPTPGPSRKGKEPRRQSQSKRARPPTDSDSEDDDLFESAGPTVGQAGDRRRKAPIAKKVRIDPSSSAPPSHQPPAADIAAPDESLSEPEAPEMTEVPPSTMDDVRTLAAQNTTNLSVSRPRQPPRAWSQEEEEAFMAYMAQYPKKFSQILQVDAANGNILQGRTQINLKDKARNLAETMIKSRAGFRDGFENVISRDSARGRQLVADGFNW